MDPALSFEKKLDALIELGCIGRLDRDRIEAMVDAGHASAHRGWRPSTLELETIMDVLENFISQAIVVPGRQKRLDELAARVKSAVPARPARPTKKKGSAEPTEVAHPE